MSAGETCPECGAELPEGAAPGPCPKCLMRLGFESHTSLPDDHGHRDSSPDAEPLRTLFPDLEIEECVGSGGMGNVWKVRQKHLDRPAALKILKGESAKDPAFAERFSREARAMANVLKKSAPITRRSRATR